MRQQALVFDMADPIDRGDFLRVLLNRKQMSLSDAAAKTGASKSLVSAVLCGRRQSRRIIHKLAEVLDQNPATLFPEEGADM